MVEDKDHRPACGEKVRDPNTQTHCGDTNDPKCLGFHSVKPRKVRGRSTSPEGRTVLHQPREQMMDSITLLMIGRRLIGLELQGSVLAPFLCRAVMFVDFQAVGR